MNTLQSMACSLLLLSNLAVVAETNEIEAMAKLDFLIGDWVGTSASFGTDKETPPIPVRERVVYQLGGSIINLNVASTSLKLQTIIRYDKENDTYFYHPFTKNSAGEYKGKLVDGKFVVYFSENGRLTFEKTESGFREYGEKRKNEKWTRYFEDNLIPLSALGIESSILKKFP